MSYVLLFLFLWGAMTNTEGSLFSAYISTVHMRGLCPAITILRTSKGRLADGGRNDLCTVICLRGKTRETEVSQGTSTLW